MQVKELNLKEIKARYEGKIPEHPEDFLEHCLTLISNAREDIPALIAEVELKDKEVEDLKEAHANKASEWLQAKAEVERLRAKYELGPPIRKAKPDEFLGMLAGMDKTADELTQEMKELVWGDSRVKELEAKLAAIRKAAKELTEAADPQFNEIAPEFRKYITTLAEAIKEEK